MQQRGIEPEALRNRPELAGPLRWYLSAFYDLSRGRQLTMGGAGPIPLTEMLAFLEIFQITNLDERAWFVSIMGALDGVYLEHAAKKHNLEKRHGD